MTATLDRLALAYTEQALDTIDAIVAATRGSYVPRRWKMMVAEHGGVQAAKRLLRQEGTYFSDGGSRLFELDLEHLTVEWSVLDPRWARLFDDDDRRLAWAAHDLGCRERRAARHGART